MRNPETGSGKTGGPEVKTPPLKRYLAALFGDSLVVTISLMLAWLVRSVTADLDIRPALPFGLVAVGVYVVVNYLFRLYHRIWQYASVEEIGDILIAVAAGTVFLTLADLFWPSRRPVPLSVVWLGGIFAFVGFAGVRYRWRVWKGLPRRWQALRDRSPSERVRVLIVGAGEAGQLLAWRFQHQQEGKAYEVVGFVDDDPAKQGMHIHGIRVMGNRYAIPELVSRHRIDLVVLAIYSITGENSRAILEICEQTPACIKAVPNVFDFIRNTNGLPIRDITAEDLLGRKPVEIDRDACQNLLADRVILVTGAAGSIGSELCRQILACGPRRLLMLDNNETGLYDLRLALTDSLGRNPGPGDRTPELVLIIGDVTNEPKMCAVFETYRPHIVFHAAAYKHVPLMEEHPDEAVRVNVLGTRVTTELAARYGVERFVLISTDKAVNPCSVMGATKRICELLVASHRSDRLTNETARGSPLPSGSGTLFTVVRFGNVLGSRGSVVPTFERQIEKGGPVTVTHPDMTRYFMNVSEAVSLVIQAAALTEGDDVFMLDMGERICIDDLARRLIRLRGLRPGVDIPIIYTGPRPGEKLHEELLGEDEVWETTAHPHIFRVRQKDGTRNTHYPARLDNVVDELIALAQSQRNRELTARLREVVGLGKISL